MIDCAGKDFVKRLVVTNPDDRMSMSEAKHHPWILSQRLFEARDENALDNTQSDSALNTQADMSLDGPSFSVPSSTSFISDASGPAPTPPESTPRPRPGPTPKSKDKTRGASTSPGTRMVRARNSNADLSMASARSEPVVPRKGKRRAREDEREDEDEQDILPSVSQKKRKVSARGSQEAVVVDGRRSNDRSLQRRRSARLSKAD